MCPLARRSGSPASGSSSPEGGWCRRSVRFTGEIAPVIEAVRDRMEAEHYARKDLFGMQLALEEALVNAVKHGNRSDPAKRVHVRFRVTARQATVVVQDAGGGFDPRQVPDPLAEPNLGRPCGRGLLLMRHYLTWIRHNMRGNRVTLCKHHSGGPAHEVPT